MSRISSNDQVKAMQESNFFFASSAYKWKFYRVGVYIILLSSQASYYGLPSYYI